MAAESAARNPRRDFAKRMPREFWQENSRNGRNEAGASAFSLKCGNLARGESMKDPVCIFECRRGFSLWSGQPAAARDSEPCDRAGLIIGLRRN
jgi:hypothetical protein